MRGNGRYGTGSVSVRANGRYGTGSVGNWTESGDRGMRGSGTGHDYNWIFVRRRNSVLCVVKEVRYEK